MAEVVRPDRAAKESHPLIEAALYVALGFLAASLIALAAIPALSRRADRLARRRAEAAFPLSLAEIAADRDHLRAELAVRERALEQRAESGFAAKAGAMEEIGRRDMTIGRLGRDLAERDGRISQLAGDLAATRADLEATQAALASARAGHAETAERLDKRIADLASVEHSLAETKAALTGAGADLDSRGAELAQEQAKLRRVEALLAEREQDLARLRSDADALRVVQVENRTQILVLEGKRDELASRLTSIEQHSAADLSAWQAERLRLSEELAALHTGLRERDGRLETVHAEVMTLQGSLAQARADRASLKREVTELRRQPAGDNAALRQEILRVAERLMALPPAQEAAE